MTIFESLQGLSLDAKVLMVMLALLWGLSEARHAIRHRADERTIGDLKAVATPTEGAMLEAHRLPEVSHGAALTLGDLVPRGAEAGQHFVGTIKNAGLQAAEEIQVTASLGAIEAVVVSAPQSLPPHSAGAVVDVRLPFGFHTFADVMAALTGGEILRLRIRFTDDGSTPRTLEECFAFSPEPSSARASGPDWVSNRVACVAGEDHA
jgi:hypothetical protein